MKQKPNILWYCTDQQRFDTISALGNHYIHTPNLDKFLTGGTAFTHAYCQSPICTPSRASFLTGMYPSAVSVNGNGIEKFPPYYQDRLIPNILERFGYDCGLVGKLHLSSAALGQEKRVADGYRYFQYSHDHKGPNTFGHNYAEWIRKRGEDPELLMQKPVNASNYRDAESRRDFGGLYEPSATEDNIPRHLHQTFWCTDKAIDFIQKNRAIDQPWFLSVNPFDPHPPFDPPLFYYEKYNQQQLPGANFRNADLDHQKKLVDLGIDFQSKPKAPIGQQMKKIQAAYYAMIEQVDTEFGRLLDFLERIGQRQNTIVIFMSDHGEMLGDHGLFLKGCRFYEGLVRVPLIISYPEKYQKSVISGALVELVDLVPTLLDSIGLEKPFYLQGQSLHSLLSGYTTKHRQSVRCEFYGAIDYPDQTHATMYRDDRWKLVNYHRKDVCELYDLVEDPWEHEDLSEIPKWEKKKWELLTKSFDETVLAHPPMSPRIQPY